MSNLKQLRDMQPDNEQITINLNSVALGRIDLLFQEGIYPNSSDLIRKAFRNPLDSHTEVISKPLERHTMEFGLRDQTVADLETVSAADEMLHVRHVRPARIVAVVRIRKALANRIH